jgi:hypothetical protein
VLIIAACALMLLGGIVLTVRWAAMPVARPPRADERGAGLAALRALWWVALGVSAGAASGALIAGAGGRLVMRLLAVTAGDSAQGAITEAEETVGKITFGGTFGFIFFVGVLGGALTGLMFVAIQRWLPGGRWKGVTTGVLLLILVGTRIEPLRTSNEDFDLVGPSWLAITLLAALVILQGVAVAAFTARWSHTMPLLTSPRAVLRYLPLAPFLIAGVPLLALLLIVLIAIAIEKLDLRRRVSHTTAHVWGRAVIAVAALVALPGAIAALADIADRGP